MIKPISKDHVFPGRESLGVLLVMPPPWGVDIPPLGVVCLATQLRNKGVPVQIFDFNIELYNAVPEKLKYFWSMNYGDWWHSGDKYSGIRGELDAYINPLIERITNADQQIIGFSLPTNCPDLITEEAVKRIKAKDPGKKVVLGGVSISIKEQRSYLLNQLGELVDYCVVGEGEEALFELYKSITDEKFEEIKNIQGVLTREKFYDGNGRAQIKDWDSIPFPLFEGLDLEKYVNRGRSLPMEFSRGCIGNCPFCDFKNVSPSLKSKSPETIVNQVKFYLEKYKMDHLSIIDPAVNSDIKNLERACDLLIRDNVSIRMSALAISRREMTRDLLLKMRKAGFYRLEYGLESGSNNVLKGMRKIFTVETAEGVIKDSHEAGIEVVLFLMVGFPGETEDDLRQTREFLSRNASYINMIRSINPLYIMAGSEIFYDPKKYNVTLPPHNLDRDWYITGENTYDIRKKRLLSLKAFAKETGITFTEETEALEFTLSAVQEAEAEMRKRVPLPDQEVSQRVIYAPTKRRPFQWVVLIFLSCFTFFYILYFWAYMKIRNRMLFGGKKTES